MEILKSVLKGFCLGTEVPRLSAGVDRPTDRPTDDRAQAPARARASNIYNEARAC